MSGYGLKVNTDENFDDLSTDNNVVIEIRMKVDGVTMNHAITIEGHKDMRVCLANSQRVCVPFSVCVSVCLSVCV